MTSPTSTSAPLTFEAFWEDEPGARWQALFERHWPHYRAWFLQEGERARASYAESARMLREHMPELAPVYERLCELAGGGDLEARLLSMWRPPPYLAGCSHAFETDKMSIYQVACHKAGMSSGTVPWSRRYIYEQPIGRNE